jgi:hypothetical protein
MSKKSRGTTGDANKRRESHARKVWGEAIPSKAAHWFDHRTKGKRRDELEQRSLAKLRRLEPVTIEDMPGPQWRSWASARDPPTC